MPNPITSNKPPFAGSDHIRGYGVLWADTSRHAKQQLEKNSFECVTLRTEEIHVARTRLKMRSQLGEQEIGKSWSYRNASEKDADSLAVLMLEAYKGTIDYEGESLDDSILKVQETIEGKYGEVHDALKIDMLREEYYESRGKEGQIGHLHWHGSPVIGEFSSHKNAMT